MTDAADRSFQSRTPEPAIKSKKHKREDEERGYDERKDEEREVKESSIYKQTAKPITDDDHKRTKVGHNRSNSMAVLPSKEVLASVSSQAHKYIAQLTTPAPAIEAVWCSSGAYAAIATSSYGVYVYSLARSPVTDKPIPRSVHIEMASQLPDEDEISSLAMEDQLWMNAPVGSAVFVAVGTYTGKLSVYEVSISAQSKGSTLQSTMTGFHTAPILSIEFTTISDKPFVVTIDCLHRAAIWNVLTGVLAGSFKPSDISDDEQSGVSISDIKVIKSRKAAAATGKSGEIDVYDLHKIEKDMQPSYRLKGHRKAVNVLEYFPVSESPNPNDTLISGSEDHTIKLWSLSLKTCRATLTGHSRGIITLKTANVNNRRILVSGDVAGRLRIWDIDSGETIRKIDYAVPVFSFDISLAVKKHPRLLTGSKDGILNEWDLIGKDSDGPIESTVEEDIGGIVGIVTGPGGDRVVVTGRGRSFAVYY
ncbi:WD40-repeat-containing domain protein [Lipomyces japonicus]|uniref:WD40-repeat-containing domain protein n=1 Tax=Lipomyces japonicus TaxID=56871 RepID=UPI0034CD610C